MQMNREQDRNTLWKKEIQGYRRIFFVLIKLPQNTEEYSVSLSILEIQNLYCEFHSKNHVHTEYVSLMKTECALWTVQELRHNMHRTIYQKKIGNCIFGKQANSYFDLDLSLLPAVIHLRKSQFCDFPLIHTALKEETQFFWLTHSAQNFSLDYKSQNMTDAWPSIQEWS